MKDLSAPNGSVPHKRESNRTTILKTSSMYLRAAKIELDEAGESTEGMAISVSKLREDILALTKTKVDIQIDDNTFKSTFQIYKELSEVWHEIADVDQAALIELIGGKRNASGIISLLTNFADVEAAMASALDSFGSATVENEKYLDSIAGRIALLQLSFETLSSSLISSDIIKGVVDIGTEIINLITWLQKLNLLLPLIAASITLIKGKKMLDEISKISQTVTPLTNQLIQQKQVTDTLATAVSALSVKEKEQLAVQIQKAVTTKALSADQANAILSTLGLASANEVATVTTVSFGAAMKSLGATLKANWVGAVITLATIAIPLITSAIGKSSRAAEEAIQKANEVKNAYSDAMSSSQNNLKSLEDMRGQFEELSKGVKSNGENNSLTNDQYKTYLSLVENIISISPKLVESYDASGNAVFNYATILQDAIDIQEEYAETQRRIYLSSGESIFSGNLAEYEKTSSKIKQESNDLRDVLLGFNGWLKTVDLEKDDAFRTVSNEIFGYDAAVNLLLHQDEESVIRDFQSQAERLIIALEKTGAYTVTEIAEIRDKINSSFINTMSLDLLSNKDASFITDYFSGEFDNGVLWYDWFKDIPTESLDELRDGLAGVIDPLKEFDDNLPIAVRYGEEFARAISSIDAKNLIEMSKGLGDGSVKIEEYNSAVSEFGSAYEGSESVMRSLLSYLYSLSSAPPAPSASEVAQTAQSYEKLADTISVAEKALSLLSSALAQ